MYIFSFFNYTQFIIKNIIKKQQYLYPYYIMPILNIGYLLYNLPYIYIYFKKEFPWKINNLNDESKPHSFTFTFNF